MEWLGECRVVMFLAFGPVSQVLVINRPGKLLYAWCIYIEDKVFNIFADNMMKLSANKAVVDFNIQPGELIHCKAKF